MSLSQEQIETKLLTNNVLNSVRIFKEDIKGLYIYGSRLWETDDEDSDLDYVVILSDSSHIWEVRKGGHYQKESDDIDLHILSETKYKELLEDCDEMALSIYFQEYPLIKYEYSFNINLANLRKSFSTKANNSYVKAKKKLQDGEIRIAYKSLYHSLRILDFGRKIAECSLTNEKIYDMTSFGENIEWFKQCFEVEKMPWEEIHKIFKPIYNSYATEFKKLAPKG